MRRSPPPTRSTSSATRPTGTPWPRAGSARPSGRATCRACCGAPRRPSRSYIDILGTPFPQDRPAAFADWLADQVSVDLHPDKHRFRDTVPVAGGAAEGRRTGIRRAEAWSCSPRATHRGARPSSRATAGAPTSQPRASPCRFERYLGVTAEHISHLHDAQADPRPPWPGRPGPACGRSGPGPDGMHFAVRFPARPDQVRVRAGLAYRPGPAGSRRAARVASADDRPPGPPRGRTGGGVGHHEAHPGVGPRAEGAPLRQPQPVARHGLVPARRRPDDHPRPGQPAGAAEAREAARAPRDARRPAADLSAAGRGAGARPGCVRHGRGRLGGRAVLPRQLSHPALGARGHGGRRGGVPQGDLAPPVCSPSSTLTGAETCSRPSSAPPTG